MQPVPARPGARVEGRGEPTSLLPTWMDTSHSYSKSPDRDSPSDPAEASFPPPSASVSTNVFSPPCHMYLTRNAGEPKVGPGYAVRNPPGVPYLVGGAVLHRRIRYDALGNANLHITYEPAVRGRHRQHQTAAGTGRDAVAPDGHVEATTMVAKAGWVQFEDAADTTKKRTDAETHPLALSTASLLERQEQQQQSLPAEPTPSILASLGVLHNDNATSGGDGSGGDGMGSPASAAVAAAEGSGAGAGGMETNEAERIYAREQDAFLAHIANVYPLVKVLPPAVTLREQAYIAAPLATTAAAAIHSSLHSSPPSDAFGSLANSGGLASAANNTGSEGSHRVLSAPAPQLNASAPLAAFTVRLGSSIEDSNTLRALAWGGCQPAVLRPATWRLLSDYAPPSLSRQRLELCRKRKQYADYTRQYIDGASVEEYILQNGSGRGGHGGGRDAASGGDKLTGRLSAYSAISLGSPREGTALGTAAAGSADRTNSRSGSVAIGSGGANTTTSPSTNSTAGPSNSNSNSLAHLAPHERAILSQLALDLPRHRASIFHCDRTVASMARCLFLWAQRHPAVGYVQGMDDLIAVFFQVFLTDALRQQHRASSQQPPSSAVAPHAEPPTAAAGIEGREGRRQSGKTEGLGDTDHFTKAHVACNLHERELSTYSVEELDAALDTLPPSHLMQVEADTYWCGGRVLALLQDNFTQGQPGIVRAGEKLDAVVALADPAFAQYLASIGVGVKEVCFQWLHCMLVRELPLPMCLLLWDTYLCLGGSGDDIVGFHVYVCAALVLSMRSLMLRAAPMDVAMAALKNPFAYLFPQGRPREGEGERERDSTSDVSRKDREWMAMLIAEAYRLWKTYPM